MPAQAVSRAFEALVGLTSIVGLRSNGSPKFRE